MTSINTIDTINITDIISRELSEEFVNLIKKNGWWKNDVEKARKCFFISKYMKFNLSDFSSYIHLKNSVENHDYYYYDDCPFQHFSSKKTYQKIKRCFYSYSYIVELEQELVHFLAEIQEKKQTLKNRQVDYINSLNHTIGLPLDMCCEILAFAGSEIVCEHCKNKKKPMEECIHMTIECKYCTECNYLKTECRCNIDFGISQIGLLSESESESDIESDSESESEFKCWYCNNYFDTSEETRVHMLKCNNCKPLKHPKW